MRDVMIFFGVILALASFTISIYDAYFGGRPMAYTREERRQMKNNERRAIAGIVLLVILTILLWFATLRAFAMAA